MTDMIANLPVWPHDEAEKPEDVSFSGEWEVVEDALTEYDRRHNWVISILARRGHLQVT